MNCLHNPRSGARRSLRINRHRRKMMMHELIIVMLVEKFCHRRINRNARHTRVPTLERHQRHAGIHDHERRTDGGHCVAPIPRDPIDQLKNLRYDEFYKDETQRAPANHMEQIGAAVDIEGLGAVIP